MTAEQLEIIRIFNTRVKGKVFGDIKTDHDGAGGHWLETQMGIKHNCRNEPDLLGYEMKDTTTSKTTFGDWSADYYIFRDKKFNMTKNDFIVTFGKSNNLKNGRYSWSGQPCPKINKINQFGQRLEIDNNNDISAVYYFSKDPREYKTEIVPVEMQRDNLILVKWNASSIQAHLEDKFNQLGWFKCVKNAHGIYSKIAFGEPITFQCWIKWVKTGDVIFDSGMVQGNSRNYSLWRSSNKFWNNLIVSYH